jgi:hypothetical protein
MPATYKILGQSAPSASDTATLYVTPSDTQTVISTITVSNRSSSGADFRISVRPGGEALANKHYIAYDTPLTANDIIALTLGVCMSAGDVLEVYSSAANLSFSAFGSEMT